MSNGQAAKPAAIPGPTAVDPAATLGPARRSPLVGTVTQEFRTLVRVVSFNDLTVGLLVPGWDSNTVILVSRQIFPAQMRNHIALQSRYFVYADLDAPSVEDLAKSLQIIEAAPVIEKE